MNRNRLASRGILAATLWLTLLTTVPALADDITDTNTFANPLLSTDDTPADTNAVAPWIAPPETMAYADGLNVRLEVPPFSFPGESPLPPSPDLYTNFQAQGDNNSIIPPDTDGAVGTNHLFVMLNSEYRISTPTGTTLFTGTLSNFWAPIWGFNIQLTDPRVIYDSAYNRWICSVLAGPGTVNSFVLVAVSLDGSPTNGFYYARAKADPSSTTYADYTKLGLNSKWFAIHVDMYALADNSLQRSQIYVFNKTNWYAGGFASPTVLSNLNANPSFPNAGTEMPALTFDSNVSALYLVQNVITNNNTRVRVYSITGNIGSETLNTNLPYLQATNFSWNFSGGANFAPQLGITNKISTDDARILNAVYRNGYLWFAHTVFVAANGNVPAHCAAQWWQVNPSNWNIVQRGVIEDTTGVTNYAYPTITVNRFGDALIGYSSFSTNQYAAASYSFRAFNDPQPGSMEGSRVLKAGEGPYLKTFGSGYNRWGDYSSTVVDPRNDADMWTIQEYAATPAGTGQNDGDGRWGTSWGQFKVVVPSNDNFANAVTLNGSQGSTNGTTVRAIKEAGEPNHAGNTNTVSVWYSWTAPTNGYVVLDTSGSLLDGSAILAVYTGSSVSSITLVTNAQGSLAAPAQVVFNAAAGTTYRVAVDGAGGLMTSFVLDWNQPTAPVFVLQPQNQTVYQGNNATLTAAAIGRPDPSYQWRFSSANISGATSSSYTIFGVSTTDAGSYTVVASNASGSATSSVAVLSVATTEATLSSPLVTNGIFRLTVAQVSGLTYIIQVNTNLSTTNWTALATNTAPFTFTDTAFTNSPRRFYRALYKP